MKFWTPLSFRVLSLGDDAHLAIFCYYVLLIPTNSINTDYYHAKLNFMLQTWRIIVESMVDEWNRVRFTLIKQGRIPNNFNNIFKKKNNMVKLFPHINKAQFCMFISILLTLVKEILNCIYFTLILFVCAYCLTNNNISLEANRNIWIHLSRILMVLSHYLSLLTRKRPPEKERK